MSVKAAIRVLKQDNHEPGASLGYIRRSCLKNTYICIYIHNIYVQPYIHTYICKYIKLYLEEKTGY